MAFADTIRTLPVHARTADAKGFLPPYFRAMGHMLHLLADSASTTPVITVDEAATEIADSIVHLEALNHGDVLSSAIIDNINTIKQALSEANAEWDGWDATTRTRNMRDLLSRMVGLAVPLDRELLGLTESDAGLNL